MKEINENRNELRLEKAFEIYGNGKFYFIIHDGKVADIKKEL